MGLLSIFRRKPLEQRSHFDKDDPEAHRIWFGATQPSGVRVTHDIALTYSAFWAAVRVISETVAQLPWHIFRRTEDGQERQDQFRLERLLNVAPNPETDAFTWRTVILGWTLVWGNGYAEIQRDKQGRPIALWQIPPDRVDLVRDGEGRLFYEVRNHSGGSTFLPAKDMLHFKGLGWDGQKGYSVVGYHAKTIGAGLGQAQWGDGFLAGSAVPAGVLSNTRVMSPQAKEAWAKRFAETHQNQGKRRRLLVIDEGMTYTQIGVPPEDAQLLESQSFSVLNVARIFGTAPHLLGEMTAATFSNIEEQSRDSAIRWIIPWSKRMAAPINTKLLTGSFFSQHILNALLRADVATRFASYSTGIMNGFLSPNDVRGFEDMNPIKDGDVYVMQGQMTTLENIANPPEPQPIPEALGGPPEGDGDDEDESTDSGPADVSDNQRSAFVDLLGDVYRRACSRIFHQLRTLGQDGDKGRILDGHARYLFDELVGPARSVYGAMADDIDAETVDVLVRLAAGEFRDRSEAELDGVDDLAAAADSWAGTRAQEAAAALFNELRTVAYVRG